MRDRDGAAGRDGARGDVPGNGPSGVSRVARAAILTLLARRAADATICPSEAARALAAAAGDADWRGAMADVHAAVDGLIADGLVRLSWQGKAMAVRDGPYRIARFGAEGGK